MSGTGAALPQVGAGISPFHSRGDIAGIQYLRGIAALMVVAHHARHYFPAGDAWTGFGSRGVDIFFVVSGFIMAHSTRAFDPSGDRLAQAGEFLRRRIVRVVPLYWIALLWAAKWQVLSGDLDADLLRDLAFIPHFHAVYVESIFPALVPGWTINYEMFFYALFALSLLFGRTRYVVLSGLLCLLVIAGLLVPWASAPALFYTRTVLLEFVFGMLVYASLQRWPGALSTPLAIAVSIASLAALAVDNGDELRGFLDGPAAALLVWSFVQWTNRLDIGWLHALGDASYSIYLFHLATFGASRRVLAGLGIVEPTVVNVVVALTVQVAVAAACGLLLHRLLERPMLRAFNPRSAPGAAPARPREGKGKSLG